MVSTPWVLSSIEELRAYVVDNRTPTPDFNESYCDWLAREHLAGHPDLAQEVIAIGRLLGNTIPSWVLEDVDLISAYVDQHVELPRRINALHCEWLVRVHLSTRPDLVQKVLVAADRLAVAEQLAEDERLAAAGQLVINLRAVG